MEISDFISITVTDLETDPVDVNPRIPRGLASVPDSMHIRPAAPKPNLIFRGGVSMLLGFFHLLTLNIRFFSWAKEQIFGTCPQKELYRMLHQIAQKGNLREIEKFLEKHSGKPLPAGYLFSEFLKIPEVHLHFSDILQGANICLEGDRGAFCQRWRQHPNCYKRLSSHKYQGDECFAIDHILFWVDPEGNTRFQFENSPLRGVLSAIEHAIDYLRYRRDNEQQGVVGISPHTEDFCLKIKLDSNRFI
ncbi:MAG: hypothetical protein K1X28_07745 [Parachlamydiales bacterium]|nr:hypothetical protein [Parachlamydiales bacterium]